MQPHLSYTTFLTGVSKIYDVKMGTSPLLDGVHLSVPLLEGLFGACGTLRDGVYASEVGMVLPRQIVKEVVGSTHVLSQSSIILLSWGGCSPCKEEKVTPCLSHFLRLKSVFKAVSNQE